MEGRTRRNSPSTSHSSKINKRHTTTSESIDNNRDRSRSRIRNNKVNQSNTSEQSSTSSKRPPSTTLSSGYKSEDSEEMFNDTLDVSVSSMAESVSKQLLSAVMEGRTRRNSPSTSHSSRINKRHTTTSESIDNNRDRSRSRIRNNKVNQSNTSEQSSTSSKRSPSTILSSGYKSEDSEEINSIASRTRSHSQPKIFDQNTSTAAPFEKRYRSESELRQTDTEGEEYTPKKQSLPRRKKESNTTRRSVSTKSTTVESNSTTDQKSTSGERRRKLRSSHTNSATTTSTISGDSSAQRSTSSSSPSVITMKRLRQGNTEVLNLGARLAKSSSGREPQQTSNSSSKAQQLLQGLQSQKWRTDLEIEDSLRKCFQTKINSLMSHIAQYKRELEIIGSMLEEVYETEEEMPSESVEVSVEENGTTIKLSINPNKELLDSILSKKPHLDLGMVFLCAKGRVILPNTTYYSLHLDMTTVISIRYKLLGGLPPIQININYQRQNNNVQTMTVEMDSQSSIQDLKRNLFEKTKIPDEFIILTRGNVVLANQQIISEIITRRDMSITMVATTSIRNFDELFVISQRVHEVFADEIENLKNEVKKYKELLEDVQKEADDIKDRSAAISTKIRRALQ